MIEHNIVLGVIVAAHSFIIARAKIFVPMRARISMINKFFENWINCPSCLSYAVATFFFFLWSEITLFNWFMITAFSQWSVIILLAITRTNKFNGRLDVFQKN